MGSSKQNSVCLTQEQKAVLGALAGLTRSSKIDCIPQSVKEMISKSMENVKDQAVDIKLKGEDIMKPKSLKVKFYILNEEDEGVGSVIVNRDPEEVEKLRDIILDDGDSLIMIEYLQTLFDSDWVVTKGEHKGHTFSYRGEAGARKLVFSQSIGYALDHLGYRLKPKEETRLSAETKGSYLHGGDLIHMVMCETVYIDYNEDGSKIVHFKWSELTIDIVERTKTTTGSGRLSLTLDTERELPLEKELDRPSRDDYDLEL